MVFFLPTNEEEPDELSASVNAPTDVKVQSATRQPTTIRVSRLRMFSSLHVYISMIQPNNQFIAILFVMIFCV